MSVALQAQTPAGMDNQSLDLVVRLVRQHHVVTPRAMVFTPRPLDHTFVQPNERRDDVGERLPAEDLSQLTQHAAHSAFPIRVPVFPVPTPGRLRPRR